MVSFGSPYLLLFLLLVPAAALGYRALDRRRGARAATWASPALQPNMILNDPGRRRYVPHALFLLGVTLLLVGFARPQAKLSRPQQNATVVLTLDISGSMAATDVHPTRLRAADAAIAQFLQQLPTTYRASLVTFADDAVVRVPPTVNRAQLLHNLPAKALIAGTAMGDGLVAATRVAERAMGKPKVGSQRPPAAILLLSDGTQNEGRVPYQAAARAAAKAGIPVSTVLLGTAHGVVCQPLGPGACQRKQVPTTPVALKQIASITGGQFFTARSTDQLNRVYKQLGSHLAHVKKWTEITTGLVGAALVAILAGALVSGLWFRRLI